MRNAKVEEMAHERLRCFYSSFDSGQFTAVTTAFTVDDALQFHAVVDAIFQQAAVIPFRFPALVEGEPELEKFLRQHSAGYEHTLTELGDAVQMELLISLEKAPVETAELSGTKYLQSRREAQQRLENAAQEAKAAAGELVQDWRVKNSLPPANSKPEGLCCYALIKRGAIESFGQRMAKLGSRVKLSGPWPATEFMGDDLDEER